MLITSIVLFVAAALGGIAMAAIRAKTNANPPMLIALLHGPLAVVAYIVLLVYLFQVNFPPLSSLAAGLLTIAALGGLTLIVTHLRGQTISLALILGHAIFAVSGVVLLLITLLMEPV